MARNNHDQNRRRPDVSGTCDVQTAKNHADDNKAAPDTANDF
jgi:hypothetical protein